MKKNKLFLSIVIPVYNEEVRLKNLPEISQFLKKQSFKSELIVVNDGSTDKTLSLLKKYKNNFPFQLISYGTNYGKGYALRRGILAAAGEYVLFCDIDLSTPLSELKKFLQHKHVDVIIGSRKIAGSRVKIRQSALRQHMGEFFTFLSQVATQQSISDFTCGFKLLKKEAAKKLFSNSKINRWGFDAEIIFLCKKYGYTLYEIPVEWKNDALTRVKFPQDIIRSFQELIQIRLNDITGKY